MSPHLFLGLMSGQLLTIQGHALPAFVNSYPGSLKLVHVCVHLILKMGGGGGGGGSQNGRISFESPLATPLP